MAFKGKVAVLMGGVGSERDVSLQSGQNVAQVLKLAGVDTVCVDVAPDRLEILNDPTIDIFWLMLHGEWGEDGQIQKILEDRCLKFTGSGSLSSKTAFNKVRSKELFEKSGVVVPWSVLVTPESDMSAVEAELESHGTCFVVKPNDQGSSVGVEIRIGKSAAIRGAREAVEKYGNCLIEEYIEGAELTVGILNGKALPIIEIKPKAGFYDFAAKYIDDGTDYLFDTIVDKSLAEKIKSDAVECFKSLGCQHMARVDFMLNADGKAYALEINTLPGFTSHSLLPKAAERAGISCQKLCLEIIEKAMEA